jgi:predicted nucleic acid-binding protein
VRGASDGGRLHPIRPRALRSHEEIRQRLIPIVNLRGLKLPRKKLYRRALDVYILYPALDFEDALTVAYMEADGLTALYSYDRHSDRVSTVIRIEP